MEEISAIVEQVYEFTTITDNDGNTYQLALRSIQAIKLFENSVTVYFQGRKFTFSKEEWNKRKNVGM